MESATEPKAPVNLSKFPEIAAYVPDRFNLSQVSKQSYKVVCKIEKNQQNLIIKRSEGVLNIMNDQLYKSMMTTKRCFDQVSIT